MIITMELTPLLTLLLISRKSKPNRTILPTGYTKLSLCILALLLFLAVEIISVTLESILDLGKDINKHTNKDIHVIFSKRSVFTYIISLPLSYPRPRRKPR